MSLAPLAHWESTRLGLHRTAQVIGAFRKRMVERQRNYRHLSLLVLPQGLTTGATRYGTLIFDFNHGTLIYGHQMIAVNGKTQAELLDLLAELIPVEPDRSAVTSADPIQLDLQQAADYARVQYTVYQAMQQFVAELPGEKDEPVVFPHGFDISMLWFATEVADEAAPHLNFGFSPGSAGLERPYLYSYPYPRPDNLTSLPLPVKSCWHTEGWVGTVTPYDDWREEAEVGQFIQQTFRQIYETVTPGN